MREFTLLGSSGLLVQTSAHRNAIRRNEQHSPDARHYTKPLCVYIQEVGPVYLRCDQRGDCSFAAYTKNTRILQKIVLAG